MQGNFPSLPSPFSNPINGLNNLYGDSSKEWKIFIYSDFYAVPIKEDSVWFAIIFTQMKIKMIQQ